MSSLAAHGPGLVTPTNLWRVWSFEPSVLIPIAIAVALYVWGMASIRRRTGARRGIAWPRYLSFLGALLVLVAALISPLDALSSELFSAHMVQHLLLIMVAAPLLILSDFPMAVLWAMPRSRAAALGRGANRSGPLSRVWRTLLHPVSAWLWFAIPMWAWHTSTFYEAALRNQGIHALEHFMFILTSMLFWWILFRRSAANYLHYGMVIPYLFTTMLHSSILGALMIFTTRPWYPYYAARVGAWGLTPLQDQQLAGLIMWVPGGVIFTLLTIGYFAAWLRALEQRSARLDQRRAIPARDKPE